MGEENDERLCQQGTDDVERRRHPKRRDAKHHIAQRSATDGHTYATDEASEPVEPTSRRMANARDGKGKRTEKLDDTLHGRHEFRIGGQFVVHRAGAGNDNYGLTMFSRLPSMNALTLLTQISISR